MGRAGERDRRRRRGRSAGRRRRGSRRATAAAGRGRGAAGAGAARVALAHHHPADIVDHRLAALVEALRAHIDDAGLPVGVLLEADHLRDRRERVAGIDGLQKPAVGVAEIGDRVQRDVGHRLAEHDVEGEQIVDRACRDSRSRGRRSRRSAPRSAAVERRIERGVAAVQRARRRVAQRLAEPEILEEAAGGGLGRTRGVIAGSEDVRVDV